MRQDAWVLTRLHDYKFPNSPRRTLKTIQVKPNSQLSVTVHRATIGTPILAKRRPSDCFRQWKAAPFAAILTSLVEESPLPPQKGPPVQILGLHSLPSETYAWTMRPIAVLETWALPPLRDVHCPSSRNPCYTLSYPTCQGWTFNKKRKRLISTLTDFRKLNAVLFILDKLFRLNYVRTPLIYGLMNGSIMRSERSHKIWRKSTKLSQQHSKTPKSRKKSPIHG